MRTKRPSLRLVRFACCVVAATLLTFALGCGPAAVQEEASVPEQLTTADAPQPETAVDLEWTSLQVDDEYLRDFDRVDVPTTVMQFDGQRVRMRGYIYGGVASLEPTSEFIFLAELPKASISSSHDCKPRYRQMQHLAKAFVVTDEKVPLTDKPLALTGRLRVKPFKGPDGELWRLYGFDVEEVEVVDARDGHYRASLLGGC